MPILQIAGFRSALMGMQWRRGLRAALAVGAAMVFCLLTDRPMGWSALGALYVCLVDNGGPYRLRLSNISGVLLLGSLAVLLGTIANRGLLFGVAFTVFFCFAITLSRVLSQSMAASSVLILICYIVGFGGSDHTFATGLTGAIAYLLGALWAAILALVLWPFDPFRPARTAIADVYASLLELTAAFPSIATPDGLTRFNEILALVRLRIEAAQLALAVTPARMTARTVRARNLAVLNESADLLLARILRFAGLAETGPPHDAASSHLLHAIEAWLTTSLSSVEAALRQPPLNHASSFAPQGSLAVDLRRSEAKIESLLQTDPALSSATSALLIATLQDTLFNLEIVFEAIRAVWTGSESRRVEAAEVRASLSGSPPSVATPTLWLETLRSNLTPRSVMFRHALRMSAVIATDTVLMRYMHVTHGYWLAMTTLIVLRPFAGETVRRSSERVAGTVAGGILAAAFTAVFTTHAEMIALVVLCSAGCVALYAVDYAWYCFFVTPAIVLLTLPRLHDWHLAAVRTEMTILGAGISVLAMLLLWPERESLQLPGLLARGAAADAAYLRAMLVFWQTASAQPRSVRIDAERRILAPARRLCGLSVNDAEETLDHALLEHAIPLNPQRAPTERLNGDALTFTTYLRRITRATTTLAAIGIDAPCDPGTTRTIASLAERLEHVSRSLVQARFDPPPSPEESSTSAAFEAASETSFEASPAADQIRRLQRQVAVLEHATADLVSIKFA